MLLSNFVTEFRQPLQRSAVVGTQRTSIEADGDRVGGQYLANRVVRQRHGQQVVAHPASEDVARHVDINRRVASRSDGESVHVVPEPGCIDFVCYVEL